jgi:hypothetical protein
MLRWILNKSMDFVLHQPRLASACVKALTYFPWVNKKLISFASNEGLINHEHAPVPRLGKSEARNVLATDLHDRTSDDGSIDPPALVGSDTWLARPKGKNHQQKSPLERWFNPGRGQ